MRPLRVAYLLASLRPGGAERQMLTLAERLPRDRFEVDFLVLIGQGDYDARATAAGAHIRVLGAPPTPGEGLVGSLRRRAGMAMRYSHAAFRGRYDIVDAWLYPADVLAAMTSIVTRTPVVISGRRNMAAHDRFGPLRPTIDRWTDRLCDAVVANSAAAAEFALASHGTDPSKLRIIRNGVEMIEPLTAEQRRSSRQVLGAGDDEVVIGCVGNYRDVKRQALLIDAFAELVHTRPELRLVLVGEGPMRPDLERQVAALDITDRVRLHGAVLDPRPLYGAFDVVVQASISEGMPNVLLEAASSGRPIVATAAGGSPEIIVDGLTGLLVPTEDRGALAAAMQRLVADPDLAGRLGAAARAHVSSAFGMERFVAEFGDLYDELAAAKGVRR